MQCKTEKGLFSLDLGGRPLPIIDRHSSFTSDKLVGYGSCVTMIMIIPPAYLCVLNILEGCHKGLNNNTIVYCKVRTAYKRKSKRATEVVKLQRLMECQVVYSYYVIRMQTDDFVSHATQLSCATHGARNVMTEALQDITRKLHTYVEQKHCGTQANHAMNRREKQKTRRYMCSSNARCPSESDKMLTNEIAQLRLA